MPFTLRAGSGSDSFLLSGRPAAVKSLQDLTWTTREVRPYRSSGRSPTTTLAFISRAVKFGQRLTAQFPPDAVYSPPTRRVP